jgi:outer membrane lipoprotein SlyB
MNNPLQASPGAVAGSNAALWAAVTVLGAASILMAGLLVSQWRSSEAQANAVVTAAPSSSSTTALAAPTVAAAEAPAAPALAAPSPAAVAPAPPAVAPSPKPVVRAAGAPAATPKPAATPAPAPSPSVTAQAPSQPSGVTSSPPSGTVATAPACVRCGVVESVAVLDQPAPTSGTGAVIGGVLGAVVGNQIGKGSGRAAATILGAIGGGVAGQQIEKGMQREVLYDVRVRMDDGSLTTVQQDTPAAVGARVTLESGVLAPLPQHKVEPVTSQPAPVTPSGTRLYSSTLSAI